MKISILQMPVAFARPDDNIKTLRRMVAEAMRAEPDVLVLPELWRLGFYPQPIAVHADLDGQQSRAVLAELARKNGVNIVGGTVANRREGKVYNTCYIFDRTGTEVASYDKAHLFTPSGERKDFAAGDNAVTFRLDGVLCAVAVCYDMRFPEFIRKLALEDISVLFLPATDTPIPIAVDFLFNGTLTFFAHKYIYISLHTFKLKLPKSLHHPFFSQYNCL